MSAFFLVFFVRSQFFCAPGRELSFTQFGKPEPVTYRYAERLLEAQAHRLGAGAISHIYGIGDNPWADIKGANQAALHADARFLQMRGQDQQHQQQQQPFSWTSVFVQTGNIPISEAQVQRDPLLAPKLVFVDVKAFTDALLVQATRGGLQTHAHPR